MFNLCVGTNPGCVCGKTRLCWLWIVALGGIQRGADSFSELCNFFHTHSFARNIKIKDHLHIDNESGDIKLFSRETLVFTGSQGKLFKIECHIQSVLFQMLWESIAPESH